MLLAGSGPKVAGKGKRKSDPIPVWGWIAIALGGIFAAVLVFLLLFGREGAAGFADGAGDFVAGFLGSALPLVLTAVMIGIYMLPTFLALGTPRIAAIAVVNLFLGWTLVGWVGALAWAICERVAVDAKKREMGRRDHW